MHGYMRCFELKAIGNQQTQKQLSVLLLHLPKSKGKNVPLGRDPLGAHEESKSDRPRWGDKSAQTDLTNVTWLSRVSPGTGWGKSRLTALCMGNNTRMNK